MGASTPSSGRPVAALTPRLLARKGSARPAMRPPALQAEADDDLGWNDLGWNDGGWNDGGESAPASVVAFPGEAAPARKAARRTPGAALGQGGKAAFTLRLDAERHLKLRLACAVDSRSAQALVTAALDRLLDEMPEISLLADTVGKSRP